MVVFNWVMANQAIVLGILFGLSEALSFIPKIKANGVFQMIFNFLKSKKPAE